MVTEGVRIADLLDAVADFDRGWHTSWHTLPVGDVSAVFYRDTVVLGILHVGGGFFIASGPGAAPPHIRSASDAEARRVRILLGVEERSHVHIPARHERI